MKSLTPEWRFAVNEQVSMNVKMEQKQNSFDKGRALWPNSVPYLLLPAIFNKVVSEGYKTNSKKDFRLSLGERSLSC